ncbi:ankyrin repeat-containing protein [Rickettsia montanensis str. OSU 85-930]|uniref:Ankyrin repeat-containing protein n=1 Tax=Rickettsia montanensis (strain OSU 85-930) TaxID=1105114 RepID=H8KDE2_RICMS|nr:ankyrin repeat-containing protein [Rickettsia montanensis str. OSU 85-930]
MMNDHENNLFATLAFGELSEVQALLKKGVNLDEHKNTRGETALHHTLFRTELNYYLNIMLVLILRIITDKRFYINSYHLIL